jgi:hypothetical protein
VRAKSKRSLRMSDLSDLGFTQKLAPTFNLDMSTKYSSGARLALEAQDGLEAFAAAHSEPGLTRSGCNESIVLYSSIAVDVLATEAA